MELYIIRHTPVTLEKGICYGQADVEVDENLFDGYVSSFSKQLPEQPELVYCSDLIRCKRLADALYAEYELEPRLREMNFGDWELKPWNDISTEAITQWSNDLKTYAPTNGENLQQLYNRIEIFLNDLRKKNAEKVVLITHAGVIRCIWAYILHIPIEKCVRIPIDFGEVFQVSLGKESNSDRIIRKG